MKHASVYGIQVLLGHHESDFKAGTRACDWRPMSAPYADVDLGEPVFGPPAYFGEAEAYQLMSGSSATLPDCPLCAMFIDMACTEAGLTGGENVEAS